MPESPLVARLAFLAGLALSFSPLQAAAGRNWEAYLGDKGASHYSTLAQITPANVAQLEVAWTWRAGDARADTSQIQCNPLVIDGVIYATTPSLRLVALDAASGRELWRYEADGASGVNRGLAWWAEGDDRRILFGTGQWLYAIDARTGRPIENFGDRGRVDLAVGLGRDVEGLQIQANTPGAIYRDLIILSTRVGEGPATAAPGHIRAYDVRTGKMAWIFHTIPHPGEPGYETWPPDAWKRIGGVNVWSGMTVDDRRGLVFCPVGSAAFDFWGGDRLGDNLYADCLLVLDAATGRHVWHYQFVRHDLWDRDPPAPPTLALAGVARKGTSPNPLVTRPAASAAINDRRALPPKICTCNPVLVPPERQSALSPSDGTYAPGCAVPVTHDTTVRRTLPRPVL